MTIISKINSFLFGGSPLNLFFSFKGTIGRLRYFGGLVFLNLLLFGLSKLHLGWGMILLNVVGMYAGFALIQKRCRDINTRGTFYIAAISLTLVLAAVKEEILAATGSDAVDLIILFLLLIGVICNLYLIFKPRAKEISVAMKIRSPLLKYPEILPVVIAAVIYAISYFCATYFNKFDNDVITAASVLYRHEIGYKKYCAELGYEMTQYPQKFAEAVATGKDLISAEVAKKGYTLEEVYQEVEKLIGHLVYNSIVTEFYDIRRSMTIYMASEQSGLPPEEIEWNENLEKVMTDKDVCAMFDENAETMDFKQNGGYLYLQKYVNNLRAR